MKVLFPVDGSECSKKTLDWATRFLKQETTQIDLLKVIPLEPYYSGYELEAVEASRILDEATTFLEKAGFEVRNARYETTVASIPDVIFDYADSHGIDSIFMGSHGRSALGTLLMGSVSRDVFSHANQPVLIFNANRHPSLEISHPEKAAITMI